MVNAIPTANTNLAGFGFGAMFPSELPLLVPVPVLVLAARFLEGLIGDVYELLHTSLIVCCKPRPKRPRLEPGYPIATG
jgi:hypothetical protein